MNRRHQWSYKYSCQTPEELRNRPFEKLASLLSKAKKESEKKKYKKSEQAKNLDRSVDENDERLFREAMRGVTPINRDETDMEPLGIKLNSEETQDLKHALDVERGLAELVAVIKGKKPIPVEKIPEYMDGPKFNMDKGLVRRLRRGQFAIQAYCELHGLRADEALQVMDGFMADAIMSNKRAVAFIHGRGKSSPRKPVLKKLVKDFLNRGRFRRYVLAYSSAPSWDGGPGVTYVLIRKRPVKKARRR